MKKTVSILLSVLMLLSLLSVVISAKSENNLNLTQNFKYDKSFTLGDADSNNAVNAVDAYVIKADLCKKDGASEVNKQAADIDADGSVTSKDVFYLKAVFAGNVRLSDFENDYQLYSFKIGGADISDFVIVLPEGTTYDENIYCAYELLYQYVNKACGVALSKEYGTTPEHGIYFNYVDDEALAEELGDDGYVYEVKDGSLYIYGTMRGNMYAVYEILEDYVGFFFGDNYYTFEFKLRTADMKGGLYRKFTPPFTFRLTVGNIWGSTLPYFGYARHLNGSTVGTYVDPEYYGYFVGPVFLNAHSFHYYQAMGSGKMPDDDSMPLADRYYARYQDGLKNGVDYGLVSSLDKMRGDGYYAKQPCTTDVDEFENLYRGLIGVIEMLYARGYKLFFNEGLSYMSFSINDSSAPDGGYCTCKYCKAKANGSSITIRDTKLIAELEENYTGNIQVAGNRVTFEKESYSGIYIDIANKAAKRIKNEYEGMNLSLIIYDHTLPSSVRPSENVVVYYCGNGCNQHPLGSGQCTGGSLKYEASYPAMAGKYYQNTYDEFAIPQWVEYCHESGTKLYFWYYPVSYSTLIYDTPNILNTYYDMHWLYEQGVDGVYYECTSGGYLTEDLKGFLGMEMLWNPAMSYDEYLGKMQKYLYMYYGKGSEYVFDAIMILESAADAQNDCFYSAFDRIWNMYSKDYLIAHDSELRTLREKAFNADRNGRVELFFCSCEFLCLSAIYDSQYTNGDSASRSAYESRYTELYNYLKDNNVKIYLDSTYTLPNTLDFTADPATQFFTVTKR